VAELLLRARPPLDVFDAAALDRSDRLAELLDANPALANARSPDGFTPLGYAAFFGGPAAARLLLERGADPNAHSANPLAVAPLHSAVAAKNKDMVALLLARGADANARQQEGYTPLMGAAGEGDEVSVLLLLAHGADPRLVSESGKTAADIAAEKGYSKIEQKLRGVTG
jgi:ankyrin repeat protein